ncbi:MAG: ZIP family metal transporter, partial [Clostridia bacterium]
LAIVFFDLIPEALKSSNLLTVSLSIVAGVIVVIVLDIIINIKGPQFISPDAEVRHKNEMAKAGFLMMMAIAMHNLPEGLVIGSSEVADKGLLMAILIGLHNIPEGIAVASPLIAGGMSKKKAVLITGATGAPTLIGAIIGYLIGIQSPSFVAISLGLAAGAMLCIIFSDMIPEAIKLDGTKKTGYATVGSLIIGMIVIIALT